VSGFAQLGLLVWGVWRVGLGFRFALPKLTPQVKALLVLMGPTLLTGGVLQINLLIGTIIATAQDGANALLNFADRLNQLPLGVIGIAVGVVLLPELSRALQAKNHAEAERLQNRSLEFALAFSLPAAVGFIVMPEELIRLVYERGAFDETATEQTAAALMAFATGLPAYVLMKVFQPAFFAREDMRTPFWFSCIMVAVNVGLSLALFPTLGHVGIAVATSVSAWVNLALLAATQWRRGDFRPDGQTLRRVGLLVVSSLLMGGAIVVLRWAFDPVLNSGSIGLFIAVPTMVGLGAAVHFGVALVTGALDRSLVNRLLRRSS
ncbi:MAG: lipid II flippase MurJ, partial [Pseudomonadota bacterium]